MVRLVKHASAKQTRSSFPAVGRLKRKFRPSAMRRNPMRGAAIRVARASTYHRRKASAASQVSSTFSSSSASARVRPRLIAATGFPARAAQSTKR